MEPETVLVTVERILDEETDVLGRLDVDSVCVKRPLLACELTLPDPVGWAEVTELDVMYAAELVPKLLWDKPVLSVTEPEPVPVGTSEAVELGNVNGAVVELGTPDETSVTVTLLLGTCPVEEPDWPEVNEVNGAELGRVNDDEGALETDELGRTPVLLLTEVEFSVGYGADVDSVAEGIPLETPDCDDEPGNGGTELEIDTPVLKPGDEMGVVPLPTDVEVTPDGSDNLEVGEDTVMEDV